MKLHLKKPKMAEIGLILPAIVFSVMAVEAFELIPDIEECPCVYGVNDPVESYLAPNVASCFVLCMTVKCFAFSYAVSKQNWVISSEKFAVSIQINFY